jgi:tetratricopeptide (TPR) repeat protein
MRYVLPITAILLGTLTCGPDTEHVQADRRHDAGKGEDAISVSPAARVWKASYTAEAAGQYQAALGALTELPGPQRESYLASFRRGWLLYRLNQHAESVAAYKLAAMAEPASIEARLGLLLPLMALTRWNDVAALAEDVLRRDPENYFPKTTWRCSAWRSPSSARSTFRRPKCCTAAWSNTIRATSRCAQPWAG